MNRVWQYLKATIADAWGAWDRFWFRPTSPETVGLVRVLAGGMLFYTHLIWGLGLDAFFGPYGFQDPLLVQAFHRGSGAMSFWTYVPPEWAWNVHIVCLAILFCFWIGLATRVTSILTFVIVVSYAHRVPLATFGLDQINCLLAMYLMLSPCGDCYSVDRLLRRFASALSAMRDKQTHVWQLPLRAKPAATLGARLIQLNMCVIYLVAGFAKLKGETWWDGTAIWLGVANYEYQSADLTWLAHYPWLINVITHTTVLWELTFCVFVWNPRLRPLVLLIGTGMHFGIGAFLGMWTFGLVMMIAYVSFTPPSFLRSCYASWIRGRQRTLIYHPASAISRWSTAFRCALSTAKAIELKPLATEPIAVPAPPAAVVTQPMSLGDWWRELAAAEPGVWPLQPTVSDARLSPDDVVVVASNVRHQVETQAHFNQHGCFCRTASDVPQACASLTCRGAECVVIYAYHEAELADVRRFRELCQAAGNRAPTTVVAIRKDLVEEVDWEPARDHRIMVFPFSLKELREEALAAWLWRTGRGREAAAAVAQEVKVEPSLVRARPRTVVN